MISSSNKDVPELDNDSNLKAISDIRAWIETKQQYTYKRDDHFILGYLRICQFDIDATKKRINQMAELRRSNPRWFELSKNNVKMVRAIHECGAAYHVIPENPEQPIVLVFKPGALDYGVHSLEDYVTFMILESEILMEDSRFQTNGCQVIVDYKDIGLAYIAQLTPSLIWRSISLQSAVPIKFNKFHVINASIFLNSLLLLIKTFLSKDLQNQIVVHKSEYKDIHEYIAIDSLPLEYSGTAGPEKQFIDAAIEHFNNSESVRQLLEAP